MWQVMFPDAHPKPGPRIPGWQTRKRVNHVNLHNRTLPPSKSSAVNSKKQENWTASSWRYFVVYTKTLRNSVCILIVTSTHTRRHTVEQETLASLWLERFSTLFKPVLTRIKLLQQYAGIESMSERKMGIVCMHNVTLGRVRIFASWTLHTWLTPFN
jgi:hypothetical protein